MEKEGNFLKLVRSRRTTYRFYNKNVSDEDIKLILEAGRWSPSCSNSQPWRFFSVKNKKMISNLMRLACYGGFHNEPAVIIALVLDSRFVAGKHICIKGNKMGRREAFMCIGMCGYGIILQAYYMGINSALLSPDSKFASKILKIRRGD